MGSVFPEQGIVIFNDCIFFVWHLQHPLHIHSVNQALLHR
jgi:hypothetical protein